jgi:hypothetical protein
MKKFGIIILLGLGILAAYWVAYGVNPIKKMFGSAATPETPETPAAIGSESNNKPSPYAQPSTGSFLKSPATGKDFRGFPLSIGSTGEYVKAIQKALNDRFGSNLVVDGIFGSKTAKALGAHGFNADAVYYKHYNEIVGSQFFS